MRLDVVDDVIAALRLGAADVVGRPLAAVLEPILEHAVKLLRSEPTGHGR